MIFAIIFFDNLRKIVEFFVYVNNIRQKKGLKLYFFNLVC